ncbi:NAD binding 10 domain containing protein [Sulfitobacter noctilucicola]|uniref:Nucleoside-diphosphate-sugar epimerase n=1 Tax=Sulfitobacter noctilucicola TaxID=1342301 RepID=A0A7W6MA86_9RHOB|nr:NAD(P)H-binding protein [Sulfitobacter noctilucicola]KIN64306.1 NAD binding 10 domain containing protein [Sulfitobacter noctilucicola]MBB4174527.1 nucleoside-diphosphate-sugar epimerase [Sulfitobacter noctilucicola]
MSDVKASPFTIGLFGAGGATGRAALRAAREKGYRVIAFDHSAPDNPEQDPLITHVTVDVLNDDLAPHLSGVDAVISCLGVGNDPQTLLDPPPLYTKGTSAICDGMQTHGLKRLVVISASFVEEKNRGPIWFKLPAMVALNNVFAQMAKMEKQLAERRSIDWTAVRPGWLMDGDATEDYTVQADVIPENMIRTRHADLGAFMVTLAASDDWVRGTPAIARHEDEKESSPAAVLTEMVGN